MKKTLFLFLFAYQVSMSQESVKSLDFIVCVDEKIATSLFRPMIIIKQGTDVLKRIDVSYYPGNFSLSSEDYNLILQEKEISIFLNFDYYKYSSKGKQEVYNYEIEADRNWFDCVFFILKVYNLGKKKYRKRLNPLSEDKNYTFDLESSKGQMIRIRKL